MYVLYVRTHTESAIAGLETACIPLYGNKIYGSASRSIESPMSGLAQCQAPRFRERVAEFAVQGKKQHDSGQMDQTEKMREKNNQPLKEATRIFLKAEYVF